MRVLQSALAMQTEERRPGRYQMEAADVSPTTLTGATVAPSTAAATCGTVRGLTA